MFMDNVIDEYDKLKIVVSKLMNRFMMNDIYGVIHHKSIGKNL